MSKENFSKRDCFKVGYKESTSSIDTTCLILLASWLHCNHKMTIYLSMFQIKANLQDIPKSRKIPVSVPFHNCKGLLKIFSGWYFLFFKKAQIKSLQIWNALQTDYISFLLSRQNNSLWLLILQCSESKSTIHTTLSYWIRTNIFTFLYIL